MPVGWLLAGLALVASGFASFAVWRVAFVVSGEPAKKKKQITNPSGRSVALALGVIAIVVSIAALPRGVFGGTPAPLEHWLTLLPIEEMAAPGAPLDSGVRLGVLVATLIATVTGFVLARGRYMKGDWRVTENARVGHGAFAGDEPVFAPKLILPFTLLGVLAAKLDSIFERTALGMPPNDLDEEES